MEQTLEQRCKVALECLPDARYRTMLARLFDELLARAAVPVVQPPEFQEVSWGVDSTMRPCTGTAVSEYAFREWAKANGVALVAPLARQEPKPDSVYPVQPSTEAATARALADGFDGSQMRPGPNHSTIEIWYDTEAQARAAHKAIRDQIEAALSSTPAPTVLHGFEAVQMEGGGSVLKPVTLELPARGAQRTPEASCWLVEKRRDGRTVAYLGHRCGSHEWVPTPGMATRFVRREDANGVAECIETDDVIVAEHIWG